MEEPRKELRREWCEVELVAGEGWCTRISDGAHALIAPQLDLADDESRTRYLLLLDGQLAARLVGTTPEALQDLAELVLKRRERAHSLLPVPATTGGGPKP